MSDATLELPGLFAKVQADISPVESGFADAIAEAKAFKGKFEEALKDLGKDSGASQAAQQTQREVAAIATSVQSWHARQDEVAAALAHVQAQMGAVAQKTSEAAAAMQQQVAAEKQAVAAAQQLAAAQARAAAAEAEVVAGVRAEVEARRAAVTPVQEARDRFRATATEVDKVDKVTSSWTDKLARGAVIVKTVEAAIRLVVASMELWHARQADVANDFAAASQGYLKFAETVKSVPIVGGIASELANAFSGGAADKAKKALEDAAKVDQHTQEMVSKHQQATAQVQAQAARARAEALKGDEREIVLAGLARDEAIANVQKLAQAKQIGSEQAKAAIDAEWTKFAAVSQRVLDQTNQAGAKVMAEEAKKLQEAKDAIQKPIDQLNRQVQTFGMTDAQKNVFDFKATHPDATTAQVEQYKKLAEQLGQLKKEHDVSDEVNKWKESLDGPIEKYDQTIAKLQEWRQQHRITQEEFEKGMNKAKDDLEDASPKNNQKQLNQEPRFASLIRAGSAEMVRLQFANSRSAGGSEEIPAKQLAKAEQQRQLQQQIRDRLQNFKVVNIA
jgi:hypothetical protein